MSLINTPIKPFKNMAFKNGEFIEVTEKDTEGKWSIFFFYPADFTFVCPTELGDLADHYDEFRKWAWTSTLSPLTPISPTKHGTAAQKPSAKSNMP